MWATFPLQNHSGSVLRHFCRRVKLWFFFLFELVVDDAVVNLGAGGCDVVDVVDNVGSVLVTVDNVTMVVVFLTVVVDAGTVVFFGVFGGVFFFLT